MPVQAIESHTLPMLAAALQATSIRHQVIASNIANVHTEGYRAQQVSFELAWRSAQDGTPEVVLEPDVHTRESRLGESAVQLDSEVVSMAQNGAHYQALLKALNRHFNVISLAATEGRR